MKLRVWFGLVLAIAIALCAVTLTVWKARKPILRLRACFHESAGLTAGAAIRVAGVEAGKVRSVQPAGPDCPVDVELALPLTSEVRSLPQNASAQIQTEGVLGPSYVEIHLPQIASAPIAEHGTIPTVEYTSGLDPKTAEKLKKFVNEAIDKSTAQPLEPGKK
jgi:ABC-type transporter Mla subunit MlaD